MNARRASVAAVFASLALCALFAAGACDDSSNGGSNTADAADGNSCNLTFGDASINLCFPDVAAFDGFVPSGPDPNNTFYLRVEDLTGSCVGQATSVGTCTIDPAGYTTNATFDTTERGGNFGYWILSPGASAWIGSIGAYVRVTQTRANGTKHCVADQVCNYDNSKDETEPFLLEGKSVGGSGQLTTIRFSVRNFVTPLACTGDSFDPGTEQELVFSPEPTISALRSGPVTLTATGTFNLPAGGPMGGTVKCDYTVKVRPSNGNGQ